MFFMPMDSCVSLFSRENIKRTIERAQQNKYGESRFTMILFYSFRGYIESSIRNWKEYEKKDSNFEEIHKLFKKYGAFINNYLGDIDLYAIYDKKTLDSWRGVKGLSNIKKHRIMEYEFELRDALTKMEEVGESFGVKKEDYPAIVVYDIIEDDYIKFTNLFFNAEELKNRIIDLKDALVKHDFSCEEKPLMSIASELGVEAIKSDGKLLDRFSVGESFEDVFNSLENNTFKWNVAALDIFNMNRTTVSRWIDAAKAGDFSSLTRDKVIALAIALNCSSDDCNRLLSSAEYSKLSANSNRDAIIIDRLDKSTYVGYEKYLEIQKRLEAASKQDASVKVLNVRKKDK